MRRETVLSADIGGTNSRFMLHEIKIEDPSCFKSQFRSIADVPNILLLNKSYENKDFSSFMDVLKQFLKDAGSNPKYPPITACIAVAGPVEDNVVRFTNRVEWNVDGDVVASELGISEVKLVNDFLAVGYGLLTLDEGTECVTLQAAPKQKNAPIACIGAGTGLGECFLAPDALGVYNCFPSEGGHAEFAPRSEVEIGLLRFLKTKFGQQHRISVERVVSGPGLVNVYEYLCNAYPDLVDPILHEKIMSAGEMKGKVIAHNQQNDLCQQTMKIFVTSYGAEAGVAALKWLPYGGLYLTGGLTPKNIDLIRDPHGPFMTALMDKGRVSGMLCSVPIYAVLVENLGQRGAHFTATKMFWESEARKVCELAPISSSQIAQEVSQQPQQQTEVKTAVELPRPTNSDQQVSTICSSSKKTSCCVLNSLLWMSVGAGSVLLFAWLKGKKYY